MKNEVVVKLNRFIRRYYINELLRGIILFFAIGLVILFITLFFEYTFWFDTKSRFFLFVFLLSIEIGLFFRLIIYPILKLFRISKGITKEEAARIIGRHFPEVNDKLLNFLQLNKNVDQDNSALLLAGIQQKAAELKPIPFHFAVDFKKNISYLKYAAIPVLIFLLIGITGKLLSFKDSYTRMVNYNQAYEPPAPFNFYLLQDSLIAEENKDFVLQVATEGNVVPENIKIHLDGESYLMNSTAEGWFSYSFNKLKENKDFYFSANGVRSRDYTLSVLKVPKILDFNLHLNYPQYIGKEDETLKGTGNATIPEGTKVNWIFHTDDTDTILLNSNEGEENFVRIDSGFQLDKQIVKNLDYSISTSNKAMARYEELSYRLKVIKDEFPKIDVQMHRDTLEEEILYFKGKVSDDYGLSGVRMYYYPVENRKDLKSKRIAINPAAFDEFAYVFPDTLQLEEDVNYELYFEVWDNDQINGNKSSKSEVFSYKQLSSSALRDRQLNNQKNSINGMQNSIDEMRNFDHQLEELKQTQKEKNQLSYADRKKFEEYLKREQRDNEMMKRFSKEIEENLRDSDDKSSQEKERLKERFEKNEERLKANEALMEELEKYRDKLNSEELGKRLEQLAKNKQSERRSLDELLELTKRYYVDQKLEKLSHDLEQLAKTQDELKGEANTSLEDQKEVGKRFEELQEVFDDVLKENEGLRKPKSIDRNRDQEERVETLLKDTEKLMQDIDNELNDIDNSTKLKDDIEENQKNVTEDLEDMAKKLKENRQQQEEEQLQEDSRMLRQILDNLLVFSFEQENLMLEFKTSDSDHPGLSRRLKEQQKLKENFKHVDDSLYALALRNLFISDEVNGKIGEIDFNMDKALETLSKNTVNLGVSHQQYVFTFANDLANLLDESLQNMEMAMEGSASEGSSGDEKFQLPDIIQRQEELSGDGDEGEGDDADDQGESGKEKNKDGAGEGEEELNAELFEIYKEQQKLRLELQNILKNRNTDEDVKGLLNELENLENSLLDEGLSDKNKELMRRLKNKMLELPEASYSEEQDEERRAKTNLKQFQNKRKRNYERIEEFFPEEEILNRENLPLKQNYRELIKEYFK